MTHKAPYQLLCKILQCSGLESSLLTEDGSNRQYFRIKPQSSRKTYILMQVQGQDALDLKTGTYSWLSIASLLQKQNLRVPTIYSVITEWDSLLIEDFGDQTLDRAVEGFTIDRVLELYREATLCICQFLKIKPQSKDTWSQRSFDEALLRKELEFFKNQYLLEKAPHLSLSKLSTEWDALAKELAAYSHYFVHRDYHSRNIMVLGKHLGLIDFQDARLGSAAYDLCSLCFDPYVNLDLSLRLKIWNQALSLLEEHHGKTLKAHVEASWAAVCLQRFLKAIGSYAFLTKKGPRDYRPYIQPTLQALHSLVPKEGPYSYTLQTLIPELLRMHHEEKA